MDDVLRVRNALVHVQVAQPNNRHPVSNQTHAMNKLAKLAGEASRVSSAPEQIVVVFGQQRRHSVHQVRSRCINSEQEQ